MPVLLTAVDYAVDNRLDASMALTFTVVMAPFFIFSIHFMSIFLPPLFVILRRLGLAGFLAVALLVPLSASAGMALLNCVFKFALEPQCALLGTFL